MKPSRNQPCPCGSGRKYKKCCLPRDKEIPPWATEILQSPSALLPEALGVADIDSERDVTRYLDEVVGHSRLLALPRVPALLHVLRHFHCEEAVALAGGGIDDLEAYRRMRRGQDLFRHLLFEIFKRCRSVGDVCASRIEDIKLAASTIEEFWRLSRLRDGVATSEKGLGTCRIERPKRLVRFEAGLGLEDLARANEPQINLASARDDDEIGIDLARDLFATVQVDEEARSFSFDPSVEVLDAFRQSTERRMRWGRPEPLPGDWSAGPYTMAEFGRFFLALATLADVHFLIVAKLASQGLVTWNSGVMVVGVEELLGFVEQFAPVTREAGKEIIRDLTYNPTLVKWTDPQYQPLIPLADDHIALPHVIISHSNFERNLLAIVDKLPWRKGSATALKDLREERMLDDLVPVARARGFRVADRLKVRVGGQVIGDLDLLLWDAAGDAVIAAQLKWYYGPDSVHEVWLHQDWYKVGAEKQLRTAEYFKEQLAEMINNHRLTGLLSSARVISVLVSKEDEPLSETLPEELPAVTLEVFKAILGSADTVDDVAARIVDHWTRRSDLEFRESSETIRFGRWKFEVPVVLYRRKSERHPPARVLHPASDG